MSSGVGRDTEPFLGIEEAEAEAEAERTLQAEAERWRRDRSAPRVAARGSEQRKRATVSNHPTSMELRSSSQLSTQRTGSIEVLPPRAGAPPPSSTIGTQL